MMLTTVVVINYLFSMNIFFVKASESYEKSYKFAWEVSLFSKHNLNFATLEMTNNVVYNTDQNNSETRSSISQFHQHFTFAFLYECVCTAFI